MRPAATRPDAARVPTTLYLAFELGNTEWKLAMTTRVDQTPLVRTVPARELAVLDAEIVRAKTHFGVPAGAPVLSCYEAGRDGFWLHPEGSTVQLEGMDARVSFRSVHDPTTATTHTVMSNTSEGAWRMTRALDDALGLS